MKERWKYLKYNNKTYKNYKISNFGDILNVRTNNIVKKQLYISKINNICSMVCYIHYTPTTHTKKIYLANAVLQNFGKQNDKNTVGCKVGYKDNDYTNIYINNLYWVKDLKPKYNKVETFEFSDIELYDNEEFRPLIYKNKTYPNYLVSNMDRIYNIKLKRFLDKQGNKKGFHYYYIYIGDKRLRISASKLITNTFMPEIDTDTLVVSYKDGNSNNSKLENLIWSTSISANLKEISKIRYELIYNEIFSNKDEIWVGLKYVDYKTKKLYDLSEWYLVSNLGKIYSKNSNTVIKPRQNGSTTNTIHWKVCIVTPIFRHEVTVGRILASSFYKRPKGYNFIEYIDGNTNNLIASNIKWVKCPKRPKNRIDVPPEQEFEKLYLERQNIHNREELNKFKNKLDKVYNMSYYRFTYIKSKYEKGILY